MFNTMCSADINGKDNFQWTPLHFACRSGNLEAVTLLVELGVNINAVTINGATPIMRAIERGNLTL